MMLFKCPAEFYPYKNLQDCYDTVVTIPKNCEEGVKANYTSGIIQRLVEHFTYLVLVLGLHTIALTYEISARFVSL